MSVSEQEQKQRMELFFKYADNLFSNIIPPSANSMKFAEVDVTDQQQCGILYELFSYGYRRKTKELLESNDPFKRELAQNPKQLFNFIADFVKASGYSPILKGFEYDQNKQLKNINMTFDKLNEL
jgi:hypothetical protein